MLRDLLEAGPYLSSMGAGVALLWILGRDRGDDEYTVDDYREPGQPAESVAPVDAPAPAVGPSFFAETASALGMWPVCPAEVAAALSRQYAEQVVAEQMRERYGTTNPAEIAARFLREIAAEQSDVVWTSTADRDLVGAFPVVAVAR